MARERRRGRRFALMAVTQPDVFYIRETNFITLRNFD
jgi:hypothetical protein